MDRADVIVFGGGMVGLALAAALDSSGLSAIIVDPSDPDLRKDAAFDGRTSAVSSSSMRMLTTIGVADFFPTPGGPIRRIQVADGLAPGGLCFDPGEGDPGSGSGAGEPLGSMHENRHLRAALRDRAEAGPNLWLLWKSAVTSVERDDGWRPGGAGRRPQAVGAAAGRRRRAQFLDPRSRRHPRRALEIRPNGDRLDAAPRTPAR